MFGTLNSMNENEDAFLAWKGDYILIQFALSLLLVSHHISSSGGVVV